MLSKVLISTIAAILVILTIPTGVSAAPTITLNVDPATIEVYIGDTFTVTINITDVEAPGLYAYEMKLYYDNTLLEGLSVEIPDGHFLTPEISPTNIFIVDRSVNQDEGYISIAVTLMGEEPGKTGSGILAVVEFNGTEVGTTSLQLGDVILVDGEGNTIPSDQYVLNSGEVTVIPELNSIFILALVMISSTAALLMKGKIKNKRPK